MVGCQCVVSIGNGSQPCAAGTVHFRVWMQSCCYLGSVGSFRANILGLHAARRNESMVLELFVLSLDNRKGKNCLSEVEVF